MRWANISMGNEYKWNSLYKLPPYTQLQHYPTSKTHCMHNSVPASRESHTQILLAGSLTDIRSSLSSNKPTFHQLLLVSPYYIHPWRKHTHIKGRNFHKILTSSQLWKFQCRGEHKAGGVYFLLQPSWPVTTFSLSSMIISPWGISCVNFWRLLVCKFPGGYAHRLHQGCLHAFCCGYYITIKRSLCSSE